MPEVVLPLTVRALTADDLYPGVFGWSDTHLAGTYQAIDRAARGELDFLAVCPPSGVPVATGIVAYSDASGIPGLEQLSVEPPLRSCGIGTILIEALEQRAIDRGYKEIQLGVDVNKSRPQALYERLGYQVVGQDHGAWDEETPDGEVRRYETTITVMRKSLMGSRIAPEDALTITDFLEDPDQSAVIDFLAEWATGSHEAAEDHVADHATGEGTTLVGRMHGTVVGLLTLRWTSRNPLFAARRIPLVHQLAVLPSYQRRGIATKLMATAERLVVDRGRTAIGITVGLSDHYGPAQRLYAQRGYVPDGRGACLGREPVSPGQNVDIDNLGLWLTKQLRNDTNSLANDAVRG